MILLHPPRKSKQLSSQLGTALVLSGGVALGVYLTRRKAAAAEGAHAEGVEKTTLINGRSAEDLAALAADPEQLGKILARAEDCRGEEDGSFALRFSAFGKSTDPIHGRVSRGQGEVSYDFSTFDSNESLGRVHLGFQETPRGVLVTGKLSPAPKGDLPTPLGKLVEKGWLAFTLRQLKMLAETGEVATTEGQPSGRGH